MLSIYKNSDGQKLYPVCGWQANQHKLYNALDRTVNSLSDMEARGEWDGLSFDFCEKRRDELERLIDIFDRNVHGGIVYATWPQRKKILDYVNAYDIRKEAKAL